MLLVMSCTNCDVLLLILPLQVELNLVWSSQIPDDATVVGVLKVGQGM